MTTPRDGTPDPRFFRVPGYEIHRKLGSGGMGTVYQATQLSINRAVALKAIDPRLTDRPDFETLVSRLKREAHSAGALNHENIVRIIDFVESEGASPVIVMEYVEGSNLARLLEDKGTPSFDISLLILQDICRGLEHAHANGVIHRDIKPGNMILNPEGCVKIMDFGLARLDQERSDLTQSGTVMGTPNYMSPEQARCRAVDSRSDIFSVGVMAYELLTGAKPFTGDSFWDIAQAILTEEPIPLAEIRPDLPQEVTWMVQQMLEKKVDARTPRIGLVRETLDGLVERGALQSRRSLLVDYGRSGSYSAGIVGPEPFTRGREETASEGGSPISTAKGIDTDPDKTRREVGARGQQTTHIRPGRVVPPASEKQSPESEPVGVPPAGIDPADTVISPRSAPKSHGRLIGLTVAAAAVLAIVTTLFLMNGRREGTVAPASGMAACTFESIPNSTAPITIDGRPAAWGKPVELARGPHRVEVGGGFQRSFDVHVGDPPIPMQFRLHVQRGLVEVVSNGAGSSMDPRLRYRLVTNSPDVTIVGASREVEMESGYLLVPPGIRVEIEVVDATGQHHQLTYQPPEVEMANALMVDLPARVLRPIAGPQADL